LTATVGDVGAAVRAICAARGDGALLLIEARLRELGLARDDEAALLEAAWARVAGRLPDGAVARRSGWASFDAVLAGPRDAVIGTARGVLAALVADRATARCAWQLALVRISDDPDRALMCDPGDDVTSREGDVLAWVEPYAGDDWRIAGRYPTVTFEPTLVSAFRRRP
jgi:hypothetical protein